MKTRILPLALLAAALAGCVQENEASPQFFAVCFPPDPDTTTGACIYPAACDSVALGTFWADVAVVTEAVAPIEIRNQLPDNSDPSTGRLNTNVAYINQFRFEFHLSGSSDTLPEEWVDANVTVPTSGSTVALVPLVPLGLRAYLAGLAGFTSGHFTVYVRAVGKYADDRYFSTGPFKVPVDVCNGCTPVFDCDPTTAAIELPFQCPQAGQYATAKCP
jgi:hypothetical protein